MSKVTDNSTTSTLTPSSRPAYEEAAIKLRNYIENQQFNPGDNLPSERKLAEQFKVSRHTLRQAFRVMEEKGILISKRGSGTYIAPNSIAGLKQSLTTCLHSETDQLKEIFEFRKILEPQVAALAAKNHKPFQIDALKTLIGRQILTTDPIQLKQIDKQFHGLIAQATGNTILAKMVEQINVAIDPVRSEHLISNKRHRISLIGHQTILNAIEKGDEKLAADAMATHITEIRDEVIN